MVATEDGKCAAGVGPCTLFDVLDPRAVNTQGNLVFGLAGNRAGVTPDAHVLVYDKAIPQNVILFVIAELTLGADS